MITKIFNFQFFPQSAIPLRGTIFNFRTQQRGFTLIELLSSIVVLVAVGTIISGIVASSLRGTNKANTIENIRQNGNYAINQVSKDIEYALPFDGKNTGLSNDDGATYATSCQLFPSPTPFPVSSGYSLIAVQSANNVVTKYKCTSFPELSANGTALVDLTSVSLLSCAFTCIQSKATDTPIIKIKFSIGPKNSSSGFVENSSPPVVFETSVIMRNYNK